MSEDHSSHPEKTESLRDGITRTLQEAGMSRRPSGYDEELHSWRCARPPINGDCRCFDELVDDLEAVFNQHRGPAAADSTSDG